MKNKTHIFKGSSEKFGNYGNTYCGIRARSNCNEDINCVTCIKCLKNIINRDIDAYRIHEYAQRLIQLKYKQDFENLFND